MINIHIITKFITFIDFIVALGLSDDSTVPMTLNLVGYEIKISSFLN